MFSRLQAERLQGDIKEPKNVPSFGSSKVPTPGVPEPLPPLVTKPLLGPYWRLMLRPEFSFFTNSTNTFQSQEDELYGCVKQTKVRS